MSANMTVLACGSNAFRQLCSSDQLVFSDPVELTASDIIAASWSQTLLRCASYRLPVLPRNDILLLGKAEQCGACTQLTETAPKSLQSASTSIATRRNPCGAGSDKSPSSRRCWRMAESSDSQMALAPKADTHSPRRTEGANSCWFPVRDVFGSLASLSSSSFLDILSPVEDRTDEAHLYPSLDALFDSAGAPPPARLRIASSSPRMVDRPAASSSTTRPYEHRIESIAAGAAHFLLLSSTQQVYSVGDSRYGQAGPFSSHPLGASDAPQALNHLSFFDGLFPIAVSCGAFHSAVVTRDGAAYLFGSDKEGQCGGQSGGSEPQMIDLEEEEGGNEGDEIVQVACGAAHTFLRTRDGQVWCAGTSTARSLDCS